MAGPDPSPTHPHVLVNNVFQTNATEPTLQRLEGLAHDQCSPSVYATPTHSREPSQTRGRLPGVANSGISSVQSHHASPSRGISATSPTSQSGGILEDAIERRPSQPYSHHRQASIVHGVHHSRNPSHAKASSAGSSGLSTLATPMGNGSVSSAALQDLSSNILQSDDYSFGRVPPSANVGSSSRSNAITASNIADIVVAEPGQKRLERMQSGRSRREDGRNQSHSRHHHPQELKTVGEYALHHLFNSFVGQADQKINMCIGHSSTYEPHVEQICGPGIDTGFDQLIAALGHIARQKPKPLIDTLMFWRKAKSEAANAARIEFSQVASASRHEAVIQAERRSTISIYLLCRVLIEIIGQSSLASVTPEMADRLEDIIFSQLKAADPDQLIASPLKLANWSIFAQLLGVMSSINFESVSDRFFSDLEKSQRECGSKGFANKDVEARMELVIMGMKHLHVNTYPEEAWDRSCDFMQSLGRLFIGSHGQRIKHAYCQVFEAILLPVAAKASAELSVPKWREFVEMITPRVSQMATKPRHWADVFPLQTILLCVSPVEVFAGHWLQLISPLQPKLKDRGTRGLALQAICRLTWTYLYRCSDTSNVTMRKLDEVLRVVFPAGKKSYLSTEPIIAEPLIQLIRFIGFKHQDLCFRTIIFPLINSEHFSSGKELRVDQLEPEKMVIGIKSFLAIMSDLEKGQQGRPPFPQFVEFSNIEVTGPSSSRAASTRVLGSAPSVSSIKEDRLSRPVITLGFDDVSKEYYSRFCEILGKITLICDNAFGGQAVLDEKFSAQPPKTPIAETFGFGRRDEHTTAAEQKQGFYDLLHVAVQALPRCLSAHIPFNSLINLLCTGTAHVQSNIAVSSTQSLKSIARQSHAQQVTIGFARFIFNFDDRYSTMSDGGMLGPGHIENTLRLYVELLQVWIEEVKQKSIVVSLDSGEDASAGSRGVQLDLSGVWAHVDEVESHGLFFLCSQSRRVRSFAVTVLRLVTEFDLALGKPNNQRIISVMEGDVQGVLDCNDERLSIAERSRLQRTRQKGGPPDTPVAFCSSEISYDTTLWFKMFPSLIRACFETCPFAVTLSREIICARLLQMQKHIMTIAELPSRGPQAGGIEFGPPNKSSRLTATPPEVIIEQWKLYLIMACTTLTKAEGQEQVSVQTPLQHARKSSKSIQQSVEKITSARSLFRYVTPLLGVNSGSIREAVVAALGSININLYKTLLESLRSAVSRCNEEAKLRIGTHQRTGSFSRRNRTTDLLRTEVTHVYKLTSHFLRHEEIWKDDWILNNLVTYTKDLRIFLSDSEVQNDWEFQTLRRHYCGLMEELFEGINRLQDPSRWMPFESRKSAFALMEEWCGYSPNVHQIRQRETSIRQPVFTHQKDVGEKGPGTAAMEIEKKNLKIAALSAMASLCGGPLSITTESGANLQFDVRRMLMWIDAIFSTVSDNMHKIGRRALTNSIVYNKEHPYLLERSIRMCYLAETPKALASYFEVVAQVLTEHGDYPIPFWKILGACLYTLGNERSEIRMKSARLLRVLEEREEKSSKIQDLDISISDKTTAVYKLAQFEISKRLSKQHFELAFLVFSEFTLHFKSLHPDHQRNMVAAILPWIQTIELQLDPNGGPTANSYMFLANLFEITIRSGSALHNEVQALWQALATGPYAGNVQVALDFIISLCLDRREQSFVDYAKQIVVFLSSTPAGLKVVEFLLMQITPKAMVIEKREPPPPPEAQSLPYLADLSLALPIGNKQSGFSLGQLALILLVDLMVSPVQLAPDDVPLLIQVVLVLWDHYTPLVEEQAREMMIHLIHELVISKIESGSTNPDKVYIEEFVESVRRHEEKVDWHYEDSNSKGDGRDESLRVPKAMNYVTNTLVEIFSIAYPGFREHWAKTSLGWATSCPVRHLACRSFQIFRCILTRADQTMLADMLARLSNTISDDETDIQTFSMEILTTLKIIIGSLTPAEFLQYSQLFWTTCACLNTIHECEFMESLSMLEQLLEKVDLSNAKDEQLLVDAYPQTWEGGFDGIQPLIYKGLKSSLTLERTLLVLQKLAPVPNSRLLGDESRLLFTVLANLPRFLESFENPSQDSPCTACAETLAMVAIGQGCGHLARTLSGFANSRYRSSKDFLSQAVSAIRSIYFPTYDFKILVFLMGLLTNDLPWFKIRTMQLLCVIIPDIDMRKSEIASHGPDLISPLLRLLQTDFCQQALEVLDHIMTMSGTPMDRHHLRMSMAGSHSRAIKKEYERTQSLFGIPEESGWSIPMPAIHSLTTRRNVHAVFYTCGNAESMETDIPVTPDVEFHTDDFQYGLYYPERTATMASEDGRGEGNMGELVMKLDSLDDFFENNLAGGDAASGDLDQGIPGFSPDLGDFRANIYDQQTLPILHKSLARTASVTSFQTGFADARIPLGRDPGVMTPAAFNPKSHIGNTRPPMHSRSVTSPAANGFQASGGVSEYHSGGDTDEVFSDDDLSVISAHQQEASSFLDGMIRPLAQGTRSRMRRFTSGSGKDKEKQRDALRSERKSQFAASPEVPRVPSAYLQGPNSGYFTQDPAQES
ncbi:hypothetical protein L228DRAFT_228990 [Xylona heveae TC161]|uniref:Cell morphogenesis protein n=1 Tax=Xylona heveae (strain CBS 132557 / TC161) TaxID=1328760 RepID=A0A165H8P0_XYLHT|nr:hypothetical protein L228DRAFT_228990 [Xylona heveae TC161]KZF23140.1 hypothetical protein L228DRAFT_228990 [Xylona heveae TC161]